MPDPLLTPVIFLSPEELLHERVFPIRHQILNSNQDTVADTNPAHDALPASASPEELSTLHSPNADLETPPEANLATPSPLDSSEIPHAVDQLTLPLTIITAENAAASLPVLLSEALEPSVSLDDVSAINLGDEGLSKRRTTERILILAVDSDSSTPPSVHVPDEDSTMSFRCEDEPIHLPGAIQRYGALVAFKSDTTGHFKVRIASENTGELLKRTPEELFRLDCFIDTLDANMKGNMIARIKNALRNNEGPSANTNLDVFTTSIIAPNGDDVPLWCALHIAHGTNDLIICEFEQLSEFFGPNGMHQNPPPDIPMSKMDNNITPEEKARSTKSGSKPLRVLQVAQDPGVGVASSPMDLFNTLSEAQQQLSAPTSVQGVLDTVVGLISELTGHHRVMFYKFDLLKNGCVDSELVVPHASDDFFRGLQFPASDIPEQARELYKLNRIRILFSRDEETARLVCRNETDFETKLDLTHSYLRAMSPIHIRYLKNMGVRSSMSVSIVINDDLWGLIACHSYGAEGLRVTLPIRELCRNIGECASMNIQRLLLLQRIQARAPLSIPPSTKSASGFIAASSKDLLNIFGADFGLLSIRDEARAIGRLDPYREALAILAYVQSKRFTSVYTSQNIVKDFHDMKYEPGINIISGLLVVPLSMGGSDFLVFFRKGQLNKVHWAGNPYVKQHSKGFGLEPRSSFKRWTESVVGVSKDWTEDQMETAIILSLLYGRFVEIWRQKEAASQKSRMTRLLMRNAAHEVRTPLNAIINYLELALENKLDETTLDSLEKAHKASKSLVYVIDDLLNLTKAEDSKLEAPQEVFDLGATGKFVVGKM